MIQKGGTYKKLVARQLHFGKTNDIGMLNASEASSPVLLSDEADEVNGATDANEGADGREASDGDGVM